MDNDGGLKLMVNGGFHREMLLLLMEKRSSYRVNQWYAEIYIVIKQCMGEFSAWNTWKYTCMCTRWSFLKEYIQSEMISKSSSSVTYAESFVRGQTMPRHFFLFLFAFWLPRRSLSFGQHHCCIRMYKPPVDGNSLPILIVSFIIRFS